MMPNQTSRPTSESSSKESYLSSILNRTLTGPDLDLNWPELDGKSPSKSCLKSPFEYPLPLSAKEKFSGWVGGKPNLVLAQVQVFGP